MLKVRHVVWSVAVAVLLATGTAAAGCGVSHHAPAPRTTTGSAEGNAIAARRTRGTSAFLRRSAKPGAAPVIKPPITWDPIPFGARRKAETLAYAERRYGLHTYRLINPHVIVIHYTDGPSFQSAYNTFAADVPDPELHELPGTCAHFVIDRAGVIHQLVALKIMCRHTVGLNWTAI